MAGKLDLQRSSIEHHKQVGKELIPPFQQIGPGMEQVFGLRDLLPEFLWIDALVQEYGQPSAARLLNDFLSAADPFNSHPKEILDGTISAFRFIVEERRQAFVKELAGKIELSVVRPFQHVLRLVPRVPHEMDGAGLTHRPRIVDKSRPRCVSQIVRRQRRPRGVLSGVTPEQVLGS
jgi:hypothetical protein